MSGKNPLVVEDYVSDLDASFRFAEDYLSDMGISRETEILREFSSSDWAALEVLVKSKSAEWLVRCARTLREWDHHEATAFNILLWMISEGLENEVRGFLIKNHSSCVKNGRHNSDFKR